MQMDFYTEHFPINRLFNPPAFCKNITDTNECCSKPVLTKIMVVQTVVLKIIALEIILLKVVISKLVISKLVISKFVNTRIFQPRYIGLSVALFMLVQSACAIVSAAPIREKRDSEYSQIPSINGVIRRYNLTTPEIYSDTWVALSPSGMRVTDVNTQSEVIKNFVLNRVWMLNQKLKVQHEVDVEEFSTQFPELKSILVGLRGKTNILGRKPCAHWNGSYQGERVWKGRVVQEWECNEDSGFLVSKQFYDIRVGLVIKVETTSGDTEELRNINESQAVLDVYLPEEHFNSVSLEEILTGIVPLRNYAE